VVEQRRERGLGPPDWWLERPYVSPALAVFMRAFEDLGSEREVSVISAGDKGVLHVGRIPWRAVEEYGHAQRLDADNRMLLHDVIAALDDEYIPWRVAEIQAALK